MAASETPSQTDLVVMVDTCLQLDDTNILVCIPSNCSLFQLRRFVTRQAVNAGIFRTGSVLRLFVMLGSVWCQLHEERVLRETLASPYPLFKAVFSLPPPIYSSPLTRRESSLRYKVGLQLRTDPHDIRSPSVSDETHSRA
mmetsp:Transcript_9466/g.23673  ORF Transcript_9466/g.23673 Transcript_9466/m.23673 type:complete len:141 (-) Transcript_9466:197-619(-)